mmetsp:Transcript_55645/g.133328  ORF Transcript_55645/g.133328 Transcript_55645/m.133328 type:complete len:256 (-) Transcript_55645:1167-1934(-)
MPGGSKRRSGYFLSISCARLAAPMFSGDMISTAGGKLSFCRVTSPDTYKSAPSVCRSGALPTERRRSMRTAVSVERRERTIAAHGAVAPARSRRLESDRAAPVPAAAATLSSTLLDGSHHQSREAESCCTRVVCGGSDCSSDGGTDGGGDGGGDGLRSGAGNESIHWSKLDTQRSKLACVLARKAYTRPCSGPFFLVSSVNSSLARFCSSRSMLLPLNTTDGRADGRAPDVPQQSVAPSITTSTFLYMPVVGERL